MNDLSTPPPFNVFNTEHCPVGFRCEICGDATDGMVAVTAVTLIGVLCVSACPRCGDSDTAPPISISTAVKLVAQHCGHLGIDLDQMAAALAELHLGGDA